MRSYEWTQPTFGTDADLQLREDQRNFARRNWFPHGVIKEGQFGWHRTQVHISLHAAFNLTHFSEDTQEARYVFNIHQQVNNFYATPIVGWDGSLNYGNIRHNGGAGWLCNAASWDWWLEDTKLPGLCISARHRAWTGRSILQTAIFPSAFRPYFISFFYSLFFPWKHCRWSIITHHSAEEGFIMGLVCWQDYCLDDKCSWSRALRWKLVVFFSPFSVYKNTSSLFTSATLRGKLRTINTSGAAQLKQRGSSWKISKSPQTSIRADEVITNTVVEFQG